MRDWRQIGFGLFFALLSSVLVLGSISLSFLESGYTLGSAPTAVVTYFPFVGEPKLTLVGVKTGVFLETVAPTSVILSLQTPTPTICPPPPGWVQITVLADDTLRSLARRYGVSVEMLKSANCLPVSSLQPGILLYVPPITVVEVTPTAWCVRPAGWVTYYVRPGDTLYRLSRALNLSIETLRAANCLSGDLIYVGQALSVPFYPPVYFTPSPTLPWTPPVWTATTLPSPWPTSTNVLPVPTTTSTLVIPTPVIVTNTSTSAPITTATNTPVPPTAPPVPTETQRPTTQPLPTASPQPTAPPVPTETPLPPMSTNVPLPPDDPPTATAQSYPSP